MDYHWKLESLVDREKLLERIAAAEDDPDHPDDPEILRQELAWPGWDDIGHYSTYEAASYVGRAMMLPLRQNHWGKLYISPSVFEAVRITYIPDGDLPTWRDE